MTHPNYHAALAARTKLEHERACATAALKAIPGVGSGPMGLTPDHVKANPQYQRARRILDAALAAERRFNVWFVKTFKADIEADREQRRETT